MTDRRLIEESFPLKEVSEHSKHEKNVRHGHISTLHIWPARRPLAASRAAIIAALMPDPGDEEGRAELNKKIASITKWGTENGPALDYFRKEIRKAYGGRAPRVLDMFAGGGAIPLEAMRLGCDVTAIDYNPVAWFILKCTLEFPQRLAGKTWPLPSDELRVSSDEFEEENDEWDDEDDGQRTTDHRRRSAVGGQMALLPADDTPTEGDLADHVRYWGHWVLERAREELAPYYPTVDGRPTVAYLWARTVPCPDPACGATVPLLKTLWLSKKAEKTLPDTPENRARPDFLRVTKTKNTSRVVINGRRALRLVPPPRGQGGPVRFEIWTPGPEDEVGVGTMAGARTSCPSCGISITPEYLKACGYSNTLGQQITVVVIDNGESKDYRLPDNVDLEAVAKTKDLYKPIFQEIPFGLPTEMQEKNPRTFIVQLYGMNYWVDIYTSRQLVALGIFLRCTRQAIDKINAYGYNDEWAQGIHAYLAAAFSKLADYCSTICVWELQGEEVKHTFQRYALPMTWDFAECNPIAEVDRYYLGGLNSIVRVLRRMGQPGYWADGVSSSVINSSAINRVDGTFDAIITDPPYYNAIPYADISDYFYVWLRRILFPGYSSHFQEHLTMKGGELALRLPHVDLPEEHTPEWYEDQMAIAFRRAWEALRDSGHLVIVFAHKDPTAWETLVAAMIVAGFTVTASWPIDTEMRGGVRNLNRASLSSSIWLVCRKRPAGAGTGRYRAVRRAMEERVTERLRTFWDMGLSGPDFVWAAVGPALESYSAYDEVRRLDGSLFTVGEFLKEVRRLVADFALGLILHGQSTEGLDEWTRYYLIHRANFGLDDAPVGECILLSQGYGLDLNELRGDRGYIRAAQGSAVRLAKWDERRRADLGEPHPAGGLPLIDVLHRLMALWVAGDTAALNAYAAGKGLRQNELFWAVAQAILEMAPAGSKERTTLEAVVAWGRGRAVGSREAEQTSWLGEE